jgi:drug/metabolite transporter (DMT)-like permease
MNRLRADLCLLLTALIWGFAFVAQKTAMQGIGPFGFTGVRFLISLAVIAPFVLIEARGKPMPGPRDLAAILAMSAIFAVAVILQQVGLLRTTVTNAGFLTGIYVVVVPFVAWALTRLRPPAPVWIASLLAIAGVWLLNGGHLDALGAGDALVLGCAACFGAQVALIGILVKRTRRPLLISAIQYALCAAAGLAVGIGHEGLTFAGAQASWLQIAYTGILSGGLAYTLQAVAQQYTPASDAAIILAGEALFAAIGGAIIMGDRLTAAGWCGCALIVAAMLLVELSALLKSRLLRRATS